MKRLLMVCALAGLAMACGDDDDDKPPVKPVGDGGGLDGGGDAGRDSGVDSSTPATVKVTNAGTACTTATASTACTGTAPVCQLETSIKPPAPVPGGSCSAVCSTDAECGPGGVCPTGIAIKNFPAASTGPTLGTVGYCNKSCVKGSTTCGTGFSCVSLNVLSGLSGGMVLTGVAPLDEFFCFPTPTAPGDGGVGDAGTVARLDGGLDAGR